MLIFDVLDTHSQTNKNPTIHQLLKEPTCK